MKLPSELTKLVRQRTWERDLVLWVGSEASLQEALRPGPPASRAGPPVRSEVLDLLDLFDEDRLPIDAEQTREELSHALQARLRKLNPQAENRMVLVVKSIGLLARYRVGVRDFYDHFCGDFAIAILLLEQPADSTSWPEEVFCAPGQLLGYFTQPGLVKHVFGVEG